MHLSIHPHVISVCVCGYDTSSDMLHLITSTHQAAHFSISLAARKHREPPPPPHPPKNFKKRKLRLLRASFQPRLFLQLNLKSRLVLFLYLFFQAQARIYIFIYIFKKASQWRHSKARSGTPRTCVNALRVLAERACQPLLRSTQHCCLYKHHLHGRVDGPKRLPETTGQKGPVSECMNQRLDQPKASEKLFKTSRSHLKSLQKKVDGR